MPLEIELSTSIKHLSGKKPEISNIYHGLEVMKVLSRPGSSYC